MPEAVWPDRSARLGGARRMDGGARRRGSEGYMDVPRSGSQTRQGSPPGVRRSRFTW